MQCRLAGRQLLRAFVQHCETPHVSCTAQPSAARLASTATARRPTHARVRRASRIRCAAPPSAPLAASKAPAPRQIRASATQACVRCVASCVTSRQAGRARCALSQHVAPRAPMASASKQRASMHRHSRFSTCACVRMDGRASTARSVRQAAMPFTHRFTIDCSHLRDRLSGRASHVLGARRLRLPAPVERYAVQCLQHGMDGHQLRLSDLCGRVQRQLLLAWRVLLQQGPVWHALPELLVFAGQLRPRQVPLLRRDDAMHSRCGYVTIMRFNPTTLTQGCQPAPIALLVTTSSKCKRARRRATRMPHARAFAATAGVAPTASLVCID